MVAVTGPLRVKVIGNLFNGRVPDGAVYVGRAFIGLKQSPFANPWCVKARQALAFAQQSHGEYVVRHHRDANRIAGGFPTAEGAYQAAVWMFRSHLDERPDLRVLAVELLRGRDLCCWCPPGRPCHADVLLEVANA